MRERFRSWLQGFIGILGLEKRAKARQEELLARLDLQSEARRIQTLEISHSLGVVSERLGNLENHFTTNHVSRPKSAEVYDWEQIQAQELAYMLAHPEKEGI